MEKKLGGRVGLIDELRGFILLLMLFYHTLYDLVAIFGVDIPLFYSPLGNALQKYIASHFVVISGLSCRLSRNNLKRGAAAFAFAMGMTAVTLLVMPEQRVLFGVLHMLSVCMMLFPLLRPALDRIPTALGAPLFIAVFILTSYVPRGWIGFPPAAAPLPLSLYRTSWLFWLGFPQAGFFSSDYFPLIPWLFLFLAGTFLGVYVKNGQIPQAAYRTRMPWLAAIGRRTLVIYLVHQPVIYGVLWLIFKAMGKL